MELRDSLAWCRRRLADYRSCRNVLAASTSGFASAASDLEFAAPDASTRMLRSSLCRPMSSGAGAMMTDAGQVCDRLDKALSSTEQMVPIIVEVRRLSDESRVCAAAARLNIARADTGLAASHAIVLEVHDVVGQVDAILAKIR